MSLTGSFRTMALPDVLQWISMGRKTGTLHVDRGAVKKRIVFREGRIVTSWSNDPRESFGQYLVRERKLTEEQLFRALLRQEKDGRLIGEVLVAEGHLSEADVLRALEAKAEETVYDLFLWNDGRFEFREGEQPESVRIQIDLDVTNVVLEGTRRVDEWARIREAIPSGRTTFRAGKASAPPSDPTERSLLQQATSGKSVAELSLELRRSHFETAVLAFDLLQRGLLEVADRGAPEAETDTVHEIESLLQAAQKALEARRFDEALRSYEQVLALDRLNQHAKKGLVAVVEARVRLRALKSVPLDKVPVVTMDLATLTQQKFDPQEGFVLSRVNGEWDVQSILKLCPMAEEDTLLIFARLLERKVIALR